MALAFSFGSTGPKKIGGELPTIIEEMAGIFERGFPTTEVARHKVPRLELGNHPPIQQG